MASPSVVEAQVAAIDNILLNAYGTVYKMAVKNFRLPENSYQLSKTEEMLSAKNVVSNLWSVLDYCCMTLHYKYHDIPTPTKARRIKFPCDHEGLSYSSNPAEVKKWGKKIEQIVEQESAAVTLDYEQFKSLFSEVQFKKEGPVTEDITAFYQLHFLRNMLTHQSIVITPNGIDGHNKPQIYQHHELDIGAQAAITIGVPEEPWKNDDSKKREKSHTPRCFIPSLQSCRGSQRQTVGCHRREKV